MNLKHSATVSRTPGNRTSRTCAPWPGIRGHLFSWLLMILITSGCTSAPMTPTAPEDGQPASLPETVPAASPPAAPERNKPDPGEATLALLQLSERAESTGSLPEAIAYAERAIRIDPRDADLWLRLATLEFANSQPRSTIQYANKALSLAGDRPELERQAWLLIADARSALGDHEAAEAIRQRWQTYRG